MAFHARVRSVLDLFHSLIAAFVPLVAGTRPLIARMRVDFPEPERPTIDTISPAAISRLTPLRARVPLG